MIKKGKSLKPYIFLGLLFIFFKANTKPTFENNPQIALEIKAASDYLFKVLINNNPYGIELALQVLCPKKYKFEVLNKVNVTYPHRAYSYTPLSFAVASNAGECVKKLLQLCPKDKRYDLIATKGAYCNALHWAIKNGNQDLLETLLSYCPAEKIYTLFSIEGGGFRSLLPLELALVHNHMNIFHKLRSIYSQDVFERLINLKNSNSGLSIAYTVATQNNSTNHEIIYCLLHSK